MLTIKIKSGKFKKDTDLIGKMDPFVRVRIGNNSQRTETAKSQGKTPTWTTTLSFEITPEQYSQPDNVEVIFEASDEDSPTTAEFLGRVSYKLAIIKAKVKEVTTLHLMNDKNKEIGTIDVELELQPTPPKLVGTVIVRPAEGKFEMGKTKKQDMCLTFVHNGIVCQTEIQDGPDGKLVFKTPILFQLYEGQDMVIRCMENKPKKPATLGEGQFQLDALAKQGNVPNLPVTLLNKGKKVAELNIELEFLKDLFGNPVRIYPVMSVGKGQCLCKKMMYSNPDMMKKSIKVISENKNLVLVKTEALTLMPNETGEMKFEINLPFGKQEGKCRVDIVVEETQMIEETLFFRVKAA